ncbi:U-scoloptoxin(16)-Er13a [Frankliniella fusca]|uniref:U-scoloptoxin(16)-Er13a n=1 Tax=Frankliniella fusca TaxID=407009 RepID=A0AAE1LH75_9NEOP|nr:U-scoloptoxin(16)-Er13a [Frankliniella fusca]
MAAKQALFAFAALCLFAACAHAAVPLSSRTTCVDAETNKVYSMGDTWFTTGERECMKLTCDGENTISGLTCAQFQVPSWCSIRPGNRKAVYPDCCPTPVCPEENAIEGSSSTIASGGSGSGFPSSGTASGPYGGYPYPPETPSFF